MSLPTCPGLGGNTSYTPPVYIKERFSTIRSRPRSGCPERDVGIGRGRPQSPVASVTRSPSSTLALVAVMAPRSR